MINFINLSKRFSLKIALRPFSQMDPRVRRDRLIAFYNRIQRSKENAKITEEWGLQIQPNLITVHAYCLNPEILTFARGKQLQ